MGKRRSRDRSSKEEEDLELSGPSCRHIKKGTDKAIVKKLSGNVDCWTNCQDCKPEDKEDNSVPSQDIETEDSGPVWMCLKCGHRGCGRHSENKHAIKHFETPRSEPHCLVVDLDNWAVWCYICDDEVQYSQTGHLAQLLTNLKKVTTADPSKGQQKQIKEDVVEVAEKLDTLRLEENNDRGNIESKEQPVKKEDKKEVKEVPVKSTEANSVTHEGRGVPVKGLSNLGNTCFFNSVIQNLSQTHILRDTLDKVVEEKITLQLEPAASSNLEPVSVNLERPGPLTLTMCQLLNEIQQTKKNVVAPRDLFTQVCKKAARFKGFQQQDSQELLRYLLDGMRAEEIKRASSGLMASLKECKREKDEEQLKTLVKEYEKNALPKNLVDQVFGGEMTSTVMCQQCKTVSVVKEMFLDLSLPVSDEAYRKKFQKKTSPPKPSNVSDDGDDSFALTNGNDDVPSGSKYQQKKAKKQAKKQAKHQRRQQKLDSRTSLDSLTSPPNSDAAGAGEATKMSDLHEAEANGRERAGADTETKDPRPENEQNSEDAEEVSNSNRFTLLTDQPSQNESTAETTSDTIHDSEEEPGPEDDTQKENLDDAFVEEPEEACCEELSKEEEELQEGQEYTVVNQDPNSAFRTLAQRASPEKQECSVRSCLFQFTEVETLTQNNSLLCVTCTKRQRHGKSEDCKKNVYTDALKQMLISTPPPVLTLHLKRFQQNGFSLCKVNRHVQFPMQLDLAPFCAANCKSAVEGDSQLLYSLYGIVEHSGTMRSGHYTAYVKVRPRCVQSHTNGLLAQGDTEAPKGSWFHISDTSVQPVTESKVQSCQAYLLFYERIL